MDAKVAEQAAESEELRQALKEASDMVYMICLLACVRADVAALKFAQPIATLGRRPTSAGFRVFLRWVISLFPPICNACVCAHVCVRACVFQLASVREELQHEKRATAKDARELDHVRSEMSRHKLLADDRLRGACAFACVHAHIRM
jgi:hypothetical protein